MKIEPFIMASARIQFIVTALVRYMESRSRDYSVLNVYFRRLSEATKRSILLKEEINKQSTFPWCGPVDLVELTRPKYYPEQETILL